MPLCTSMSDRSKRPLLYERLRTWAMWRGTKRQKVGEKLYVVRISADSSRKDMLRPSRGRIPEGNDKIESVRTEETQRDVVKRGTPSISFRRAKGVPQVQMMK